MPSLDPPPLAPPPAPPATSIGVSASIFRLPKSRVPLLILAENSRPVFLPNFCSTRPSAARPSFREAARPRRADPPASPDRPSSCLLVVWPASGLVAPPSPLRCLGQGGCPFGPMAKRATKAFESRAVASVLYLKHTASAMVCVRPSRGGGRAPENWASAVRRPLGHFEAVRRGHSLSSAQDSRSGAAAPRAEARRRFWALPGGGQGARPRALRVPRHGARPGRDQGSCIGG